MQLPVLHSRFRDQIEFDGGADRKYQPLPAWFRRLPSERVAVFNMVGEHVVIPFSDFEEFIRGRLPKGSAAYQELKSHHLLLDSTGESAIDVLALKYREKHASISRFTGLHIFVVTLRCDHSCPYCQVSRVSSDRGAFDMSAETADRALDLALKSPNPNIKIEFQGGESLLNFEIIQRVVLKATAAAPALGKTIDFVIATNLSPLTDPILEFCAEHRIALSTSLDGPQDLHNSNRPRPGGDSWERAVEGIRRARERLGFDQVSALMTTTRASLSRGRDIIDAYVGFGFPSISLRWLSPFGFANRSSKKIGYPLQEFFEFYEHGLRYIFELNRNGIPFREDMAALIARRMLTPFDTGYVDLMSPAGIGTAAIAYNYDGKIYASDESRMLAENNDFTFQLGDVHTSTYREVFNSDHLRSIINKTMVEGTPMCHECAYHRVCGTDPVVHHATQGDMIGTRPTSVFCLRQLFLNDLIVRILADEPSNAKLLEDWANQ